MTTVKANSPEQELEWALIDLRDCEADRVEAILAKERAEDRVARARKALHVSQERTQP